MLAARAICAGAAAGPLEALLDGAAAAAALASRAARIRDVGQGARAFADGGFHLAVGHGLANAEDHGGAPGEIENESQFHKGSVLVPLSRRQALLKGCGKA